MSFSVVWSKLVTYDHPMLLNPTSKWWNESDVLPKTQKLGASRSSRCACHTFKIRVNYDWIDWSLLWSLVHTHVYLICISLCRFILILQTAFHRPQISYISMWLTTIHHMDRLNILYDVSCYPLAFLDMNIWIYRYLYVVFYYLDIQTPWLQLESRPMDNRWIHDGTFYEL